MKNAPLNALAAGLSVGLAWGIGLFIWTFVAMQWGTGASVLEMMSDIYPGYGMTTGGAFSGLICGFLDGFLGTYVVVFLYNFFAKKLSK